MHVFKDQLRRRSIFPATGRETALPTGGVFLQDQGTVTADLHPAHTPRGEADRRQDR
jgi:hypothetical protein